MEGDLKLPSLYYPTSVAELLTPDTISKLLLGFTAGLHWMPVAMQERGGVRHDLWGTPENYWCAFCTHFRRGLKKEELCVAWDRKVAQVLLGEQLEEYSGQEKDFEGVFRCHAGILEIAEVIRLGGRPFAVLHGGQLVPKSDAYWAQSLGDRLANASLGLTPEQVAELIRIAHENEKSAVTPEQLARGVELFRLFAREFEGLLEKLYKERRHATEEVLLHALAARILSLAAPSQEALWGSLTGLLTALRRATALTHVEWFMGSEQERFALIARSGATPEWKGRSLSVGRFWEELRHSSGTTTGKRWDGNIKEELRLAEDNECLIYPLTCVYGAPSRNVPAALVMACQNADAGLLADFLPRLGVEIARGISTAISEIEKNRVIQAAAAEGAYVGHDMKMPLQILVNAVPALRGCIARLGVADVLRSTMERVGCDCVLLVSCRALDRVGVPVGDWLVQHAVPERYGDAFMGCNSKEGEAPPGRNEFFSVVERLAESTVR